MAKKTSSSNPDYHLPSNSTVDWNSQIAAVAKRFDREYRREAANLPPEVESMPIFREWASGSLQSRIASPFWELMKPQKNQHCLDLGCGLSFLIYPCWREWPVYFHGQEISTVVRDAINSRGPQMNSKLFKGVNLGPADQIKAEPDQFDWAIATGFSCYYPPEYWSAVLVEGKRVLKPGGQLVFDVLDPDAELAENWAILETYLGAEVFLEPLADWEKTIQAAGGQITASRSGELFQLYRVRF
uniref:Methyltransferase type 11 n=1 Tax=Cyanothece sp. (strain PCC 7425 / ATCC 29141) TaxID=395961 RepID=B8HQ29_CYAP4